LESKVAALESEIAKLRSEKEAASTELTSSIAELKAALAAKETELASVSSERDALKTEKETAAREAGVNGILDELHAVHPFADDAARAAARETAALAYDDAGVLHRLKLERTVDSLKAKLEEATKAKEDDGAAKAAEEAKAAADAEAAKAAEKPADEKASKETFNTDGTPVVNIAPGLDTPDTKKGLDFTAAW
jgi:hypothetical protein